MKKLNIHLVLLLSIVSQKLLAAPPSTSPNVGLQTGPIESLVQASFIVQLVILILLSLSVLCWAIAWSKYNQFKKLKAANEIFDQQFWKMSSLDDLFEKVGAHQASPHARVFKAAYVEMKKIAESPLLNKTGQQETDSPQLSGIDNLERSMHKAIETEVGEMESRLTVLASTGSTGPFIGLFGTVWGIMNSFHQIGKTGSASLAAVAPGISEALITTAVGLVAAIPAVIIYNHYISLIRKEEMSLNNFSADFLNIVKRNFFKG
ncbi:MAG: protein TolQ [Bdellovibrionaceae bacterium]|nr:protein TolQ [Bdellovibrio sp.]